MKNNMDMFNELDNYMHELNYDEKELIAILHKAQEIFGYLPRKVQEFVANKLNISVSRVYGVVTFYSFFTMTPKGKYVINVCLGTACFVRGSDKILQEFERLLKIENGQTTSDNKYTLSTLRCVGACGLAPVVSVNNKTYGNVKVSDVINILKENGWEE
ncbi:MAG: NAD(P)H-dependent oxidoreductase subunit E [Bacilli bacterium]|nr:NAD(P)H-dependent oxidoreductase subunit E [Bacilli bacterium]